jgi:hypothetical protein
MEAILKPAYDRTRNNTPERINRAIDERTKKNIAIYTEKGERVVRDRIKALDKEWDVDRAVVLWASGVLSTGLVLAKRVNSKWLILPAIVSAFLAYHALRGWCPPVSLFRRLKFRTRKEIDAEKYALIQKMKERGA